MSGAVVNNTHDELTPAKKRSKEEIVKPLLDAILTGSESKTRVAPSVVPSDEREKSTFSTIRQGTATNALSKVKADTKRMIIDPITGEATMTQGDLTVTISGYTKLSGVGRTSAHQLLDALEVSFTESGAKSPSVSVPLIEYIEKRGLKDRKAARIQVEEDLDAIFNSKISFKEKRKNGQEQDFHDIRIIESKGIRNGIINVTFSSSFYNILLGYPIMAYPEQLWRLKDKLNPNSYYLLRKVSEHKNMNVGKKNEDIIAVKTLLAASPYIPSYDEVMEGNRNIQDRIIDPFERDMDALKETLTWEYCHSNGAALTDDELANMSYKIFSNLLIKVKWNAYPDQTARLERKAERMKKAEQGKKPSKKKATGQRE